MNMTEVRREALDGGHVKGAMVRAHVHFLRDRFGEATVQRALAALPEAASTEVHNALTSSWCSFGTLIRFDRAIADVTGHHELELMRELGRSSAEINLSGVYRAFRRDDIHEFFRRSAALHRQFQDFGTCEYEQVAETQGRIRVREAACYSPIYCASETGYLEKVIAIHGGRDGRVVESACQCAKDNMCTFELHWH